MSHVSEAEQDLCNGLRDVTCGSSSLQTGEDNLDRTSVASCHNPSKYFYVVSVVLILIQHLAWDSRLSPRSPLQTQGRSSSRSLSMTTARRVHSVRARVGLQAARGGAHLPLTLTPTSTSFSVVSWYRTRTRAETLLVEGWCRIF